MERSTDRAAALAAYGLDDGAEPVSGGLVNLTWSVGHPPRFALQLLNAEFTAADNRRSAGVAEALVQAGIAAPRTVATADGRLELAGPDGRIWRLTRWIDADVHQRLPSPGHVRSAGVLLARVHDALADAPAGRALPVGHFHDTEARMARLEAALPAADAEVREAGEAVLALWRDFAPGAPRLPFRPAHGDPKAGNLLYRRGTATAFGILDLDTVARHQLDVEVGDALRSWCADAGGRLDAALVAVALDGYLATARTVSPEERAALPAGLVRSALELAARYATDAARPGYFAWDPAVAPDPRSHSLMRCRARLALARQALDLRAELERAVRRP